MEKPELEIRKVERVIELPLTEDGKVDYEALETPSYLRRKRRIRGLGSVGPVKNEFRNELSSFASSLRPVRNDKLDCIDFYLPNETQVAFREFADSFVLGDREPSDEIILAMLEMAKEKFGEIEVYGSPSFVERAINIAVANGIALHNEEYMQAKQKTSRRMRA